MSDIEQQSRTLGHVLATQAGSRPHQPCLQVVGGRSETYAEVYDAARRVAAGLARHGVGHGDPVVIMARNGCEAVHAWLGANLLGAIDVSINTAYRGALLEHALNVVKARHIVLDAEYLPLLKECESNLPYLEKAVVQGRVDAPPGFSRIQLVDFDELASGPPLERPADVRYNQPASVIYTSGTSGPAKAVVMPHAQTHMLARHTLEATRLREDDVFYCVHPLFHIAGKFMAIYAMLMAGGKTVLNRSFAAEDWLGHLREYGATVSLAHGPMIEMVHAQPERPDDADNPLRRLIACPLPKRIAAAFERRFGFPAIEVWGMTEVGVPCWRPYDEPLRPGSSGKVRDDAFDFRIVDPETDEPLGPGQTGEFVVRAKAPWTLMQGYMGMPDKTVEAWRNLWFHTGDSGYIDGEGYVYYVDRLGDRIRRRAENISSYDIESAALQHADVAEAAAVGVASEFESDDDIKLCVVAKAGRQIAPESLFAYLVERLPHYMVPRYLEVLDALPRTPTNKVKRAELRARKNGPTLWDRKAAGVSVRDTAQQVRKH